MPKIYRNIWNFVRDYFGKHFLCNLAKEPDEKTADEVGEIRLVERDAVDALQGLGGDVESLTHQNTEHGENAYQTENRVQCRFFICQKIFCLKKSMKIRFQN